MAGPDFVVDFPTLGDLVDGWIGQHCLVPDGFLRGKPFKEYDWQFWCTANHYRVREDATWLPERPLLNQAFVYRRSQVVAPQKMGKGPWSATITATEAVGPCLFGGWAKAGDVYDCADHGCPCGWYWEYEAGEPKGIRHPSPLIQLTATSEDQVESNQYRHLRSMINAGPLKELLRPREGFMRIVGNNDDPDLDRIDIVTASANSRVGNPISFAIQDESGLYTVANKMRKVAEGQRRGAAGMGGRTMETSNAWDPSEQSVAQSTFESQTSDVFKFFRQPPANLSYRDKRERRRIHKHVYAGAHHVDLDSIEAEAAELLEKDPSQAERFFGNKIVHGMGTWLPEGLWAAAAVEVAVPPRGTLVCGGFDGSLNDDWTAIRLETFDGLQFTPRYGPDRRLAIWDPKEFDGEIPRHEVHAAWAEINDTYVLGRAYCDPGFNDEYDPTSWASEIDTWGGLYGEKVFVPWRMNGAQRVNAVHAMLVRFATDLRTGALTHDRCPVTKIHVENCRKLAKGGDRFVLGKPNQHQKIDAAVTSALCHEAASDARAAGWGAPIEAYAYVM